MCPLLLKEFIEITKRLNSINITPTLMGSVGLEFATEKSWHPIDLDFFVPGEESEWNSPDDAVIYQFDDISKIMASLNYKPGSRHKYEFVKDQIQVEIGCVDTLSLFTGIPTNEMRKVTLDNATFLVPTIRQLLKMYRALSEDDSRSDKSKEKDMKKVAFLESQL